MSSLLHRTATVGAYAAGVALVATLVVLVAAPAGGAAIAPAAQARPSAPVAADGLQASDGQRTLRVGQARGLAPGGQAVGVAGSGYDVSKGIYVALCVVTPPDQAPSPCGGGIDQTGATGASAWVSSDPPSYGRGLATPYGAGGAFSVTISVAAVVAPGYDCRQVQCAIVSRNDHTRTADRSQDIFVPVRFGAEEAPVAEPTPTTVPATTAPPTTIAPPPAPTTTAPAAAPPTEVSADGLTGTQGGRTVRASAATDLDPAGEEIEVSGEGFAGASGLQVTLCRTGDDPSTPAAPCLAGSSRDASKVVLPAAEAEAVGATPLGDDGSFSVTVEVAAVIDADTDCRDVACALVVRRYAPGDAEAEVAARDRSLDVAIPLAFAAETPTPTTTTEAEEQAAAPVARTDDGDGGPSTLPLVLGGVGLAALAAVAAVALRARRGDTGAPTPGAPDGDGTPAPGSAA